jgi:hypothetical protein
MVAARGARPCGSASCVSPPRAGRIAPELGGSEARLDIVGVNFYPETKSFGLKSMRRSCHSVRSQH